MITYLLLPTFTTKAMDAAKGFVAGERLDIRIAMLLDFGNWQQEDIQRFADDYQRPAESDAS